jgi:hypothetical protein
MAISTTPLDVPMYVNNLFKDLLFGAETIEKGLVQVVPMARNKINMDRFTASVQNLTARVATPTTAASALTKDEKVLTMAEIMFYDEFDPKTFNVEPEYLRTIGPTVDAQAATVLLNAIREKVTESFNYDLEQLLWNGDTTSGDAWLDPIDGFVKLIDADTTVNSVTPAGAVTASNVIAIFEAVIQAVPNVVKEKGNVTIVTNHSIKNLYRQAARALDYKGTNITEAIRDLYGGYPIVSTNSIPANRIFAFNANSGETSELKVGVWSDADKYNVKIERLQANSDLFFIKINAEVGVQTVWGKQITEYSPA